MPTMRRDGSDLEETVRQLAPHALGHRTSLDATPPPPPPPGLLHPPPTTAAAPPPPPAATPADHAAPPAPAPLPFRQNPSASSSSGSSSAGAAAPPPPSPPPPPPPPPAGEAEPQQQQGLGMQEQEASPDSQGRLARLQRKVVLRREELMDVTAFYFEGAIKVREGVSKRRECAVQLGVVSVFFVSTEQQSLITEVRFADVAAVSLRDNDIVISRGERDPVCVTVVMPHQRRTILKCLYLRFEGKGVAFPPEIFEEAGGVQHHPHHHRAGSPTPDTGIHSGVETGVLAGAPHDCHPLFGSGKENQLAASYYGSMGFAGGMAVGMPGSRGDAASISGCASLGGGVGGVPLLPKAAASLRSALSVLSQLEDGNGAPSSPLRKLSPYSTDTLYAPGVAGGYGIGSLRSESRIQAFPDAFRREKTYANPQGTGSALTDFLKSTEAAAQLPSPGRAAATSVECDRNSYLRQELRRLQADTAKAELKLEGKASHPSTPATPGLARKKLEGFSITVEVPVGERRSSAEGGGGGGGGGSGHTLAARQPHLVPPSPRVSPMQRLASRDREHFASALAMAAAPQPPLSVLPDVDLATLDVASLVKPVHDLPPPHTDAALPLRARRRSIGGA